MKKIIVFLDWNDTLSYSKFWDHLPAQGEDKKQLFSKIESTLFGELRPLIKPWMRGEHSSEEICQQIADKSGISYEIIFSEFITGCRQMTLSDERLPGILNRLRSLGYLTVIATDNMDSFTRYTYPEILKRYDIEFDDMLNSADIGALKEDVDDDHSPFFRKYLSENSVSIDRCVLIDDSPDSKGSFEKFGLELIQIQSADELIAALNSIINSAGE